MPWVIVGIPLVGPRPGLSRICPRLFLRFRVDPYVMGHSTPFGRKPPQKGPAEDLDRAFEVFWYAAFRRFRIIVFQTELVDKFGVAGAAGKQKVSRDRPM